MASLADAMVTLRPLGWAPGYTVICQRHSPQTTELHYVIYNTKIKILIHQSPQLMFTRTTTIVPLTGRAHRYLPTGDARSYSLVC